MKKPRNQSVIRVLRLMRLLREPMTALELCGQLGVCKRTIWRDMDILLAVGVPLRRRRVRGKLFVFFVDTERTHKAARARRELDEGIA